MDRHIKRFLPRLVRQTLHTLILLGLVVGLNTLDWFGFAEAKVYVAYVLTEPVDLGDVLSRLDDLAGSFSFDAFWPPWRPRGEEGGATDSGYEGESSESGGDGNPDAPPIPDPNGPRPNPAPG